MDVPDLDARAPMLNAGRSPANAGSVTYPPRARLGPRLQYDYQLVAVHAGWVRVAVDGRERDIPAGYVGLLLPGGTEHFEFGQGRLATHHSWIALSAQQADRAFAAALAQVPPLLPLSTAMIACIEAGREVARPGLDGPDQAGPLAAVARAALLLYTCESRYFTERTGKRSHDVVDTAQSIIRRRAAEGITVEALALAVGVSPEHLVRLFRAYLGTTPGALLREARLALALHLLTPHRVEHHRNRAPGGLCQLAALRAQRAAGDGPLRD